MPLTLVRDGRRTQFISRPKAMRLSTRRGARYARRPLRGGKKSNKLTTAITKVLNSQLETKYVAEPLINNVMFNSTILAGTGGQDWYRAFPLIQQGGSTTAGTSWSRVGKNIQPIKCKAHFEFKFDKADINQTRDIFVVFYMVQNKNVRSYFNASPNPGGQDQFLDNGDGTGVNYNGTWAASKLPVEKDSTRLIHKRVFRLCKASGDLNGTGVVGGFPAPIDNGMYVNPPGNFSRHLTLNVPTPKVIRYQENGSTGNSTPANFSPVWGVGYYYANGLPADTLNGCLQVSCRLECWFKDS